jgi:hypothetical protein
MGSSGSLRLREGDPAVLHLEACGEPENVSNTERTAGLDLFDNGGAAAGIGHGGRPSSPTAPYSLTQRNSSAEVKLTSYAS